MHLPSVLLAGLWFLLCTPLHAAQVWGPMPDAAFGVFLDEGRLQDFTARLPVPAQEALRRQAEPIGTGEALVVAFLGTSAVPAKFRIDRTEKVGAHELAVHLVLRRADNAGDPRIVQPHALLASANIRRDHLPEPPFDVRFLDEQGSTIATLRGIRQPPTWADDPFKTGDPWGVTRQLERVVEERCGRDCPTPPGPGAVVGRGRNLVRVHDTRLSLFYTFDRTGTRLWVGEVPDWLQPVRSRCYLTDQTPEAIANGRAEVISIQPHEVLTINGLYRVTPGNNVLYGQRGKVRLPGRAWLACDWSQPPKGMLTDSIRDLGTWVIDLYPVELHPRPWGTIEIADIVEAYHDITLRLRLFPPLALDRDRAIPIRLWIHNPPALPGTDGSQRLGAFLYYGFDRDPNRGAYVVHFGNDDTGRSYAWLTTQDENGPLEYELQLRLAPCRATGDEGLLGDDACNTISAVQTFYTHAEFLRRHRLNPPVTLRFSLESPKGYRSKPFQIRFGDEPDTPWAVRRETARPGNP